MESTHGLDATTAADFADQFTDYARAARGSAVKNKAKGDKFGEQLASTRADVYAQAADLVRAMHPQQAAVAMMERAGRMYVRTPPLMGFDEAGVRYITARAWQFCALEINPELEHAAPQWT